MIIPNFYLYNLVQGKDNYLPSTEFQFFLNELVNVLAQNLSGINNTGYTIPSYTTAQIATFAADPSVPLGTMWFDNVMTKMVFKSAPGTTQVITSV